MKRITLVLLMLGLCSLANVGLGQDVAEKLGPKIACDEPTYNFGDADSSQDISHTFVLRNEGDENLEISNVKPSCGCTVANITTRSVPPGGESLVTTKLALRGRQGRQRKGITVSSNDPKTPSLMLYIEGNATKGVDISPSRLFFGQLAGEDDATRSAQITFRGEKAVTVTEIVPDNDIFTAKVEPVEAGKVFRLDVSTKTPMPMGRIQANVKVRTDHPSYKELNIPVAVTVVGKLAIAPQEIVLVEQANSNPVTRYVVVRPGKVSEFKIGEVIPPEGVTVQILPMGQNGYRIQLDNLIPRSASDGQSVKIKTDVEGMEEVTIPIKVVPAQPAT